MNVWFGLGLHRMIINNSRNRFNRSTGLKIRGRGGCILWHNGWHKQISILIKREYVWEDTRDCCKEPATEIEFGGVKGVRDIGNRSWLRLKYGEREETSIGCYWKISQ